MGVSPKTLEAMATHLPISGDACRATIAQTASRTFRTPLLAGAALGLGVLREAE